MHLSPDHPTSTSDPRRRPLRNGLLAKLTGIGLAHAIVAGRRIATSLRSGDDLGPSNHGDLVVVDDPDGTMRLIGVAGAVDHDVIGRIDAALGAAGDVRAVHLDVSAVERWSTDLLRALETVLDRIEDTDVRLRVVGLDPRLPALPVR